VKFSVYLDKPSPGPVPCDIFYEVVDQSEHQLHYGKRRVNLTGKDDEFLIAFSVDEWEPGPYRVNLRARAYSPERDATSSAEVRVDATRAMLGANFESTMEILAINRHQGAELRIRCAMRRKQNAADAWANSGPARDPGSLTVETKRSTVPRACRSTCIKEYSQFGPGWRSDRGRVYIKYGPPEQIDNGDGQPGRRASTRIWRYYSRNMNFVSTTCSASVDYKLVEGEY
jgi:GWxTD domain-containing protein